MATNINELEMYLKNYNYAFMPYNRFLEVLHHNSGEIITIKDNYYSYEIMYNDKVSYAKDELEVSYILNSLMSKKENLKSI